MISFPKDQVIAACFKYGPLLVVEGPLDGTRLMQAIAAVESGGGDIHSIGHDCGPRHESAYDVNGSAWRDSKEQQHLVEQFGSDAACSYGPWQTMFINCPGYTFLELKTNLDDCARAFVAYFNSYVVHTMGAKTLDEIAEVYNAGHVLKGNIPPGVQQYINQLGKAYIAASLPTGKDL